MAATMHAKINRRKLDKLNIIKICEEILNPTVPMALRLSGILRDDVTRLMVEINEAWKVKAGPDPTVLPKGKTHAKYKAVTLPDNEETEVREIEQSLHFCNGTTTMGFQHTTYFAMIVSIFRPISFLHPRFFSAARKTAGKQLDSVEDSWSCPEGFVKLNVDGSIRGMSAAAGGLIRDSMGAWKTGFAARVDASSIEEVELKAVELGLELAREKYCTQKLILEVDSRVVHKMVTLRAFEKYGDIACKLAAKCKKMLNDNDWTAEVVRRKANTCADHLASMGHEQPKFVTMYLEEPPKGLKDLLEADRVGL